MTVGVIMLVHTALQRAEQVARHWAASGCPVVIHVDKRVPRKTLRDFSRSLALVPDLEVFSEYRCEWGTWGIVEATQAAAEHVLSLFPEARHVLLTSESCLPLRPPQHLKSYLADRPHTDFIESASTEDVHWTVGGLDSERFSFSYPFAWKKNRFLFDGCVQIQRRLRIRRALPEGIIPHMGSQWWCLSRNTLSVILRDPARAKYDNFFRRVWIPDESYFQTLARKHSATIESRSLTLSKFDFLGKPHVFYDDHLHLLRRSDCFVARKIWPKADLIYNSFLNLPTDTLGHPEPNPGKIDRVLSKAVERRVDGRSGLYMQSRFPRTDWKKSVTAMPYFVFQGFTDLFENFEEWLSTATESNVHGHLFAKDRAYFSDDQTQMTGALCDSAFLRDYAPKAFLTNLIWNTRGKRQCFQFSPVDAQEISDSLAKDPNAKISIITGAWAVRLFQSNKEFSEVRQEAARLQKVEGQFLRKMQTAPNRARVRMWNMAEFSRAPMEPLQAILDDMAPHGSLPLSEVPRMVNLDGFGKFLRALKNQGMHPYLMGDFPVDSVQQERPQPKPSRPYLVR